MAFSFLVPTLVGAAANAALGWLRRGEQRLPARVADEARGEVRSDVAPKRWIVGRARVAGVLVRHVDYVDPSIAAEYWDVAKSRDQVEVLLRRERADRRMYLLSSWAWALSEGRLASVDAVWVDGVRMNAAFVRGSNRENGDIVPADDGERQLPFWVPQILGLATAVGGPTGEPGGPRRAVQVYQSDDLADRPQPVWTPSVGFWFSNGTENPDVTLNTSSAIRQLRKQYASGNATEQERQDIQSAQGTSLSWLLARFKQTWATKDDRPWRRDPLVEVLCTGEGPIHDQYGPLLGGNPAAFAYWLLTERFGVSPAMIDSDSLEQSLAICDEDVVVLSVTENPTEATAEQLRAFVAEIEMAAGRGNVEVMNAFTRQSVAERDRARATFERFRRWLDEVGSRASDVKLDTWYDGLTLAQKGTLYGLWRVKQVVEQATGRPWTETTGARRASILAQWRKRFTGDATDSDGLRKRYAVGGVYTSDMDDQATLDEVARSMNGSIERHGSTYFIRAGSHTFRASATITDDDVVDNFVSQLLEPSVADQPTEVRASIAQDETAQFEARVMAPLNRRDANLGDVLGDDRPGVVRVAELGYTLDEWTALSDSERQRAEDTRRRVLDMGTLAFVTNPFQAAAIQRHAVYSTRWDTRTLNLRVGPGKDFQFYGLSKGATVNVLLSVEGIQGDVVGERVDPFRAVVVERPRILEDGNVELVLRQQDEDTFGERHGLVFDYLDSPDVLLVGGAYTPTGPVTCTLQDFGVAVGETITAGDRWRAEASGGSGRLTFSLEHRVGDPRFLAIDSGTGVITGTPPAGGRAATFYFVTVVVRDEVGRKASCTARLWVDSGGEPEIEFFPPAPSGDQGTTVSFRAAMSYPADMSDVWDNVRGARWTFAATDVPSWVTVASNGQCTAVIPAGESLGVKSINVRATAPDGRTVDGGTYFTVTDPDTFACHVEDVRVQLGVALPSTSIGSTTGGTGAVTVAEIGRLVAGVRVSNLPIGLSLDASGNLSGTVNNLQLLGTHAVLVEFTDSDSPAKTVRCTFRVHVEREVGSCSIPARWNIPLSGTAQTDIGLAGFTGRVQSVAKSSGPCWATVVRSGAGWRLEARDTDSAGCPSRAPGAHSMTIQAVDEYGGRAACSTVIVVASPPPLTLRSIGPVVDTGEDWSTGGGGLSATGGTPPYRFSIQKSLADVAGLAVNESTGALSGTAPTVAGSYPQRASVADSGGGSAGPQRFLAVVNPGRTPTTTYCVVGETTGQLGATVSLQENCVIASGGGLVLGAASQSTGDWAGTAWALGAGVPTGDKFTYSVRFTTTVPSSASAGTYTFENRMRDKFGDTIVARAVVVVNANNTPITCSNLVLRRKRNEEETGHQIGAVGGDQSVSQFTFGSFVNLPGWMSISNRGLVTFRGQDSPACATSDERDRCWDGIVAFNVSRGAVSATCRLAWQIVRTDDGGGGGVGDDDEDEPDPGGLL